MALRPNIAERGGTLEGAIPTIAGRGGTHCAPAMHGGYPMALRPQVVRVQDPPAEGRV